MLYKIVLTFVAVNKLLRTTQQFFPVVHCYYAVRGGSLDELLQCNRSVKNHNLEILIYTYSADNQRHAGC